MPEGTGYSKHWLWLILAAVVLVLILIGVFPARVAEPPRTPPVEAQSPARGSSTDSVDPGAAPARPEAMPSSPARDRGSDDADNADDDRLGDIPFLDREQEIAVRWAQVDLDEVRASMPDNLYWKLGAPTTDPAIVREREEERSRWNDAYGQVLAGTASADEIHDYYAQRHRVSSDYVEFGSHLLERYGDVLPARDVGLLEFSVKMHRSRLQQMPRRLVEALERKDKQDRLREAWLSDEEAFEQALLDPHSEASDTAASDSP